MNNLLPLLCMLGFGIFFLVMFVIISDAPDGVETQDGFEYTSKK